MELNTFNNSLYQKIRKSKLAVREKAVGQWNLIIALRLYSIIFLLIFPLMFFLFHLKYLSPTGIIILGLSVWLILKYVLFASKRSSIRFLKVLLVVSFAIILNFFISLIYYIINGSLIFIFFGLSICIGSLLYFIVMIVFRPFTNVNFGLNLSKRRSKKGKYSRIKKRAFKRVFVFWILISISLMVIPYPVYAQNYKIFNNSLQVNTSPNRDFGIWTYGQSLNEDNIDEPEYIQDQTLDMLGKAGIYFVYGLNVEKLKSKLVKNIIRCREHSIEVHISVNPLKTTYTNVWSFESFRDDIEEVLKYLEFHNLTGDPITSLVYDMEVLPDVKFPFYGLNINKINKLNDYNEIQLKFKRFNNYIKDEYNLKIRITTDISQGFDFMDGDDDLSVFSGLLSDKKADMAYMVYRRNYLGQNLILDHCKFLNDGDTIILNAWRDEGHMCWKSIDCAIRDARLVLGYPKKSFRLEIWDLSYFLFSFGENGLTALVDAINEEVSDWSEVIVWNIFPYSFLWDSIFIGYIIIDLYGPLFRAVYGIM